MVIKMLIVDDEDYVLEWIFKLLNEEPSLDLELYKAKELLKDSKYQIQDIHSQVGLNSASYFGKIFKKETGFSPLEYREQKLRKSNLE